MNIFKIRLDFERIRNATGEGYRLLDSHPFPADLLPALLIYVCQEIGSLPLPEDNTYMRIAKRVLSDLGMSDLCERCGALPHAPSRECPGDGRAKTNGN